MQEREEDKVSQRYLLTFSYLQRFQGRDWECNEAAQGSRSEMQAGSEGRDS